MFSEELLGLYILISASATCTLVRLQTGQSWKHLNIECPAGCHCSSCRKTMRQPALRGFTTNHVWAPCCLLSPRSDCFKPGKRHDQQVRKEVGGLAQNIRAPLFFIFRHYASQLHLCKPKYKLIRWKIVGNWTVCVWVCQKLYERYVSWCLTSLQSGAPLILREPFKLSWHYEKGKKKQRNRQTRSRLNDLGWSRTVVTASDWLLWRKSCQLEQWSLWRLKCIYCHLMHPEE